MKLFLSLVNVYDAGSEIAQGAKQPRELISRAHWGGGNIRV